MNRIIKFIIILASVGITLAILFSFLNAIHPAFDLIANFRFHLAVLTMGIALIWLMRRQIQIAVALFMFVIFALNSTLSGLPKVKTSAQNTAPDKAYSLLHFNVSFDNADRGKVLEMILNEDADIFMGVEFSSIWSDVLFRLQEKYAHVYHCPEWRNIGGGYIFSKFPFTNKPTYCHEFAALGVQEVIIENTPISIGVAHLRWPWPASQPKQLIALKPYLSTLGDHALIAGDFNATTWTFALQNFATNGGLNIVENIGPTWLDKRLPMSLAKWIGLPIDNALYKGDVVVTSAKSLAPVGSDHLPIKIEFSISN